MAEFVIETPAGERRSLAVSGEFDLAAVEEFLSAALGCIEDTPDACEIDLGAVTFIDSSGLGALVRVRKAAHALGKEVVLTNVPTAVIRLFEVTGLTEAFGTGSGG
jgi:anti-anti-sigma factor